MRSLKVVLLCSVSAVFVFAQAPLPVAPAATTVTASGATATSVSTAGAVTTVTTATVSGGNAYNDFSQFQVAPGSTVDLKIPGAASNNNLLNLVNGSQTQIFGTVNSLLAGGQLGGNVYFADPQGIVVGGSGVINVGSLTLVTPTQAFADNFMSNLGSSTAQLLAGSEPVNGNGLIAIAGTVNAAGPITLVGGEIDLSGTLTTGVKTFNPNGDTNFNSDASLADVVNLSGLETGQSISVNGNAVTIDGHLYGGSGQARLEAGSGNVGITSPFGLALGAAAIQTTGNVNLFVPFGSIVGSASLPETIQGNEVTLNAPGDIVVNSVSAQDGAIVAAGHDNDLGQLTAGGSAILVGGRDINLGTVTAGGNAVLTTGRNINLGAVTATNGIAELIAGGGINAGAGSVTAGYGATLWSIGGDLSVGDVSVGNGDVTLRSAGALAVDGLVADANGTTQLQATGNIDGPGLIEAARIGFNSNAGSINNQIQLSSPQGWVTASAPGAITLDATQGDMEVDKIQAGGDVKLLASTGSILTAAAMAGTVTADNLFLNAPGDIALASVTAQHGAIVAAGRDTDLSDLTAGTSAILVAGRDLNLGLAAASGGATLNAGRDINLGSLTAANGTASLIAGDAINAGSGSVTAGDNASLMTLGGSISLGSVQAGNSATLNAGGDLNLGGVTATGGDAALTAGGSINAASGTVTAGHDANLTATGGGISLGTISAGNDAGLNALGDIDLAAGGAVTAGDAVTMTSTAGSINPAGTITAPAVALIAAANIGGGGTITAATLQLAAEGGAIGSGASALNLNLNTINGVTPVLTAAARYDANLNVTAVDPRDGPVPTDTTLYANLAGVIAGGNLNLTLNQGVETIISGNVTSQQTVNAGYEIPAGDLVAAGGALTVTETGPNDDPIKLNVDGALASGFQNIQYTVAADGSWTTAVTAAGQTATALINYAQSIGNGVIDMSDIDAAQGGVLTIAGNGRIGGAGHIGALQGYTQVGITNNDPGLVLQLNAITTGRVSGSINLARPTKGDGGIELDGWQGQWRLLYGNGSAAVTINSVGGVQ